VLWEVRHNAAEARRVFLFDRAFPSRDECQTIREAWIKIAAKENAAKAAGLQPDDDIRHYYECVPDTVDPRGAKGK
jgi:hypothetical protein